MNTQPEMNKKPNQADLLALLPTGTRGKKVLLQAETATELNVNELQKAIDAGAVKPVKAKAGKAKPLSPHKSKQPWFEPDKTAFTGPMLPMLGKASKTAKRGVFNDMGFAVQRIIINPSKVTLAKYGKAKQRGKRTVNESLGYHGIGVKGDIIKTVIKSNEAEKGQTAFAVIWQAIDAYRLANNDELPTGKYLKGLNLQCIKKGETWLSTPSPITIDRQLWAYKIYHGFIVEKAK